MGGRGARSASRGGDASLNPGDILSTREMVVLRGARQAEVDATLTVARDIMEAYGYQVDALEVAELKGRGASVLAYYDGANVAVNQSFFDKGKMDAAYAASVKTGFHPSSGKKSGFEAVIAHEMGHGLTDAVADKMGFTGANKLDRAAASIVNQARKKTKHRGVVQLARKISGYATYSNAEAIAEACADVYCNGGKAKAESRAIMSVVDSYLKS